MKHYLLGLFGPLHCLLLLVGDVGDIIVGRSGHAPPLPLLHTMQFTIKRYRREAATPWPHEGLMDNSNQLMKG